MFSNKKIIAFDIDGTLTVSKRAITESMALLLKELIKKKTVIATSGGKFEQFKTQFLPPFDNDKNFNPFIHNLILLPTSATQRYEFNKVKNDWELVEKEPLDSGVKERVKKLLEEVIDSGLYEIPPNPKGEIVEDRDTQITFSALGQLAPIEEKRLWDPDQKKRKKIVAVIEPKLPEVTLLINSVSSIDIVPKGFNKAVGIELLLKKLGLQKSDLIFVGDGLFPGGNDYSLHEAGFETVAVKGPEETELIIKKWLG
ncbi:hypothetical protein A3F19_01555 [Candidatus Nomurabacteria bacterium RIFCSPHIGHO2_12_FULL_37_29]|uniref:phosphomannomutase n=2 Tax=Candidatus Nomuraibacteriota TaxID=1752729 RepID=A0A1F6Y5Q5_9BACT|nr:MAG: hypothetical protein A2727_00160 [Candidatus Nomurabacteria bacterium RIFCSPHIGHO2_01_FULL_37_110]OGI79383.1 MAG: hypothetical protein A3F19_01555 [Candidatus Nomurabacteria bacterium RIFCSPHIGHO2_12_FULL_37_29]OGI84810.1 MAG: hypothetical protein A3A92_00530 [Candidatus Nomurabacteria bacterium RIFCSPLOWO2_01_FULL_37_49]OGJ01720.1 MAG: hypothetical protein A3G98_02510 [Candidatus Nomurabacteria bacterium RIFCSPLOWO2_12_FULL_37_8]